MAAALQASETVILVAPRSESKWQRQLHHLASPFTWNADLLPHPQSRSSSDDDGDDNVDVWVPSEPKHERGRFSSGAEGEHPASEPEGDHPVCLLDPFTMPALPMSP